MLKGRLGLETARVPHADRHGMMWLGRGNLIVEAGTLRFLAAGDGVLDPGDYAIPVQSVSCIALQPGTTVSHDALRILANQGTGLVVVGEGGVRLYASLPHGPDESARARRHARLWADESRRLGVARRMYAWRLGEVVPASDIAVLRGIEGARMKARYAQLAKDYGIAWGGRRYDRMNPEAADEANQAINHAATAVEAAAAVAVAAVGAVRQLGFIHEDSGNAFVLDVADLYRDTHTIPIAFGAVKELERGRTKDPIERVVRKLAGSVFRREKIIARMIDRVKEILDADDDHRGA